MFRAAYKGDYLQLGYFLWVGHRGWNQYHYVLKCFKILKQFYCTVNILTVTTTKKYILLSYTLSRNRSNEFGNEKNDSNLEKRYSGKRIINDILSKTC